MTFQEFMDENREQMIRDVMELVSIPSVFNEEDRAEGQPFGGQVRRGLEWILRRAEAWGGINYYVQHADGIPDYSIVPGGYFPLIFCEKGLLDIDFEGDAGETSGGEKVIVTKLEGGGSGRNIVPGKRGSTRSACFSVR